MVGGCRYQGVGGLQETATNPATCAGMDAPDSVLDQLHGDALPLIPRTNSSQAKVRRFAGKDTPRIIVRVCRGTTPRYIRAKGRGRLRDR